MKVAGRQTALLAVQEAPPVSLLVVLEVSREVFGYQDALRRGIDRLAARLRPDDEIGVVVFGSAVLTLFPLSSDHLDTRRKVLTHHLQAVGPLQFRLDDALLAAVEALADRDGRGGRSQGPARSPR